MASPRPGSRVFSSLLLDHGSIGLGLLGPVRAAPQVRHGRQHVERVAARRRERGVAGRRAVQVQAEILGQHVLVEDVVEQSLVARAHDHVVVQDVVEAAVRAEVPDDESHRMTRARRSCGPSSGGVGDRAAAGCRSRPVRRSRRRGRPRFPRRRTSTTPAARPSRTTMRSTSALQRTLPPVPSISPTMPVHQRAGAAHRVVHAEFALEMRDQAVVGGGRERIAADQQRMKAEDHPQVLVLEEFG